MKKNYMIRTIIVFLALIIFTITSLLGSQKIASAQNNFGEQCQKIINALNFQANYRTTTGTNTDVDADSLSLINNTNSIKQNSQNNINLPNKFDLRNCDLDGQGNKNYVTSVKNQKPWGTCWAFAAISASETSILSKLKQNSFYIDADGNKHDSIDLSEHHLVWFNYSPMQNFETSTQTGEGSYCILEEQEKEKRNPWWQSYRMHTGGAAMSANCSFAMGEGPVIEPEFSLAQSPIVNQILYKNLTGKTADTEWGHVFSTNADWSIDPSLRKLQDYKLKQGLILPDATTPKYQDYDIERAEKVTALMKEQLWKGRAMEIAYKSDYGGSKQPDEDRFINPETWAHYTWKKINASHAVTVVGWDDNYSIDNFLPEHQPPKKGAWIVKNSWGAMDSWGQGLNINKWGVEDTGYFYLSYYDQSLINEAIFDYDLENPNTDNVIINQYDYMPCENPRAIEQTNPITTANIFTADQDQNVAEISTVTSTENETVNYKIYKLANAGQRIDQGELIYNFNKYYEYKGYHREKLDQAIRIDKGETFAVAVSQQANNKYLMGVAYDANKAGYEAGKSGDDYYCVGVVNPGESFLYTSSDDQWTDFSIIKKELESDEGDAKYYTYDNFPIKAYSTQIITPQLDPEPQPTSFDTYETAATSDNVPITLIVLLQIIVICSAWKLLRYKKC